MIEESLLVPTGPYCLICNNRNIAQVPYANAKNVLFTDLLINICPDCEISWVDKNISAAALQNYYQNKYGAWRSNYAEPTYFFSNEALMFKPNRSRSQLNLLCRYSKKINCRRLLDIGAGFGTTLYIAKSNFFLDAEMAAVEPDDFMQKYLQFQQVNIYKELSHVKERPFDIIIASHVLEHCNLFEVGAILDLMRNLMSKHTLLLVEVPNDNIVRFEGASSSFIHEPHLTFFSEKALKKIFRHKGYNVIFSGTVGKPLKINFACHVSRFFKKLEWKLRLAGSYEYGKNLSCIRMLVSL